MSRLRCVSLAFAAGFLTLMGTAVEAQIGEHTRFLRPANQTTVAPEQPHQLRSHLLTPIQRLQNRGELGLVTDHIMVSFQNLTPTPRLLASFLSQSRNEGQRHSGDAADNKAEAVVNLLHKSIRAIEEELHSSDGKEERAELQKKLKLVIGKLEQVEAGRRPGPGGDRRDGDRRDGDRRDGDRRDGDRRDGDRRDGDRRDGDRRDGEDREHADRDHGDHEHGEHGEHGEHEHPDRDHDSHDHAEHNHSDHNGPHHAAIEKIRALHEAAERLMHGGMPEMAHQLHRQAEEIEKSIDQHHSPPPERILMELMENMEQLRREVHEVNERLDQIMKRLDRPKGNRPLGDRR